MKNFYFLLAAGCMTFAQAHADTAYQYEYAQTKSQAEGLYLSDFWEKALTSHAFVDAFSDAKTALVIDKNGSVRIVGSIALFNADENNTDSDSRAHLSVVQSQK
jgi:hypothetical protein